MFLAKEKLSQKKYKAYLIFWLCYFAIAGYNFFAHTDAVLGEPDDPARSLYILLYAAVIAAFALTIFYCFRRWGREYRPKEPNNHEYAPRIKWYHFFALVLTDVYSFFVLELVNNSEKLAEMDPLYISMNLLGGLIMGLILFFWFNSLRRACVALYTFATVMSLIFYFVYMTRGEPLQLIDIFSFKTAWGVAGGYEFVFTRWITVFLLLTACIFAIGSHMQDRCLARKRPGKILMRAGVFVFMIIGYRYFLYGNWNVQLGIVTDLWAPHDTYEECGTNLGFFCVAKFMKNDPPAGYSKNVVEQNARKSEEEYSAWEPKPQADAVTPVNIIAIMNESWADYRHVDPEFSTSVPYMEYVDSLQENIIKGHTMVCIWGGGTSKSEYEFLTGNSVRQYPGLVPFVNFYTHDQYSLVSTLKDQGYETIAMHPNKGTNWNRVTAYQYLGFDRFYTLDDFGEDAQKIRGMISDRENYEKIVDLLEAKENPSDPLFIFNVTMQNHGGYSTDNYKNDVSVNGFSDDAVNRYLSLAKNTDEATEYLIEYLKGVEEPTMVLMFGDHFPGLEQIEEFLSGKVRDELPADERTKYFETPFFIWTNYESETRTDVITSCNFLGTIMLEKTGLAMTPYNHYLQMLKAEIQGYNHIGYYDALGNFHAWADAEEGVIDKRTEYEYFQYNALVESRNRADWFFTIPDSP